MRRSDYLHLAVATRSWYWFRKACRVSPWVWDVLVLVGAILGMLMLMLVLVFVGQ